MFAQSKESPFKQEGMVSKIKKGYFYNIMRSLLFGNFKTGGV